MRRLRFATRFTHKVLRMWDCKKHEGMASQGWSVTLVIGRLTNGVEERDKFRKWTGVMPIVCFPLDY